jgi:hypothetical protein
MSSNTSGLGLTRQDVVLLVCKSPTRLDQLLHVWKRYKPSRSGLTRQDQVLTVRMRSNTSGLGLTRQDEVLPVFKGPTRLDQL